MAILSDTKDWTWVLEQACPECAFDASALAPTDVAELVRANARDWQDILGRPHDDLRRRPSEDRWSALEYACHVRDVFRIADERISLMLEEDDPTFLNWDQDETAVVDQYNDQDPAAVARGLLASSEVLVALLDGVSGADWERPGRRSDGARFTVGSFARYLTHDPIHHVWDVTGSAPAR